MSYDGNGKPGNGVWSTSHESEWDVVCRHPGNKTNRLQREPARGWNRRNDSHESVQNSLDAKRHQRSSGAVEPPGRKQTTADRLILMGDWRDLFAAMI